MKNFGYSHIYFVGIGGIGMSALARFFMEKGYPVAGYDKTKSQLTQQLENEGAAIHYTDWGEKVEHLLGNKNETLIIYTPAVPNDLGELLFLKKFNYTIKKRAEVLGLISAEFKTLAVAGTHGKTTTSTLLAHVLKSSQKGCNAFLGGISTNYNSNYLVDSISKWMVVEADEYDRSFHQLHPYSSIITSIDADHLDIYHTKEEFKDAFTIFAQLTSKEGHLVMHNDISFQKTPCITYGIGNNITADYHGKNTRVSNGYFTMDVATPTGFYENIQLGIPGTHNLENALAVIALSESIGLTLQEIQPALKSFKGVKRRFEHIAQKGNLIYIDDYAHHPTAIESLLKSVRLLYPNQTIHLVFQPHLYTRTRDFMVSFATSLSRADELILMPIYPARESPIQGVTSETLAAMISSNVQVMHPEEVLRYIETLNEGILITAGAGSIDRLVEPIKQMLS